MAPRSYAPVLRASGFGAEGAAIHEAFRKGDHAAIIDAVPDRMVEQMSVCGSADEVREVLPAFEQRYDRAALYSPSCTLAPERVEENTLAIIETLAR